LIYTFNTAAKSTSKFIHKKIKNRIYVIENNKI